MSEGQYKVRQYDSSTTADELERDLRLMATSGWVPEEYITSFALSGSGLMIVFKPGGGADE